MGRILAIDFGRKRTGLAVTDSLRITANPLITIPTHTLETWLKDYFSKETVDEVVIGHPYQMNGEDSESMQYIQPFINRFQKVFPNMPLKETELPMPSSPYAAQKASGELYLKSFHESYGLNYVALRYFNVFGPRQDENSPYAAVIPKFISAILKGESPVIYGDGEQSRDFIFVKEIAKANIASAESNFNGVLNVALGKSMTINQLFDIVSDVLESDLKVKYLDERPGDIKHSLADISNLEKINFKPEEDKFEEQLRETVKWFKEEMEKKN